MDAWATASTHYQDGLFVRSGGASGPTLLLLHGLGMTSAVWASWRDVLEQWPGRWVAPDLRGHGRSSHRRSYSYGAHAADVAGLCDAFDEPATVVGHSMGGVVALALASGLFGGEFGRVVAVASKPSWTDREIDEVSGRAEPFYRPYRDEGEALTRYALLCGLPRRGDDSAALAEGGVTMRAGHWALSADPRVHQVQRLDVPPLLAAATARGVEVVTVAGESDPLIGVPAARALDPSVVVLGGGHNVHIEAPGAIAGLLRTAATARR